VPAALTCRFCKRLLKTSELKLVSASKENQLSQQNSLEPVASIIVRRALAYQSELQQMGSRILELEAKLAAKQRQETTTGVTAAQVQATKSEPFQMVGYVGMEQRQRPPVNLFQNLGPSRLLVAVLEMVGGRSLLLDVPLVCKDWKATCRDEDVSALLNFKECGMENVGDFALVVMLQRFPSARRVDLSGQPSARVIKPESIVTFPFSFSRVVASESGRSLVWHSINLEKN
jgi:hypothetical protein